MILQSLVEYYELLVSQDRLSRPGWSKSNISYALYINDTGELEQVISLQDYQDSGKKTLLVPRSMLLPAPVKRSSGISPNFLWDNSSYILGIDAKGKPQRSLECFNACKELHRQLLDGVDSSAAIAVLAFFDHWNPALAYEHPALSDKLNDILSNANLNFWYNGSPVQDDPFIKEAWQKHYDSDNTGPEMVCLVTGKKGPIEAVHPSIKGVAGAQSSGAALVSFNAPAFCSYGHEQNFNAPTGKYAAFAYTSALNYLLSDREHIGRIGDTTVLFWAKGGQTGYQDFLMANLFGQSSPYSASDLRDLMLNLCSGKPVDYSEEKLDPNMEFYILGLSPNAARLSVRFFLKNSFGNFVRNVMNHYDRLEIVRPSFDNHKLPTVWMLLNETVNQNSREKAPVPILTGETIQAILTDSPYPASLLNSVTLRIRAEHKVTWGRAAILKAYYLKKSHHDVPKEVLDVSLNPNSINTSYTLGRLFSVYEAIQTAANPGINTTIKDKYFNSAASTPATIFPILGNLAQKHLKKLRSRNRGLCVDYEKQLGDISSILGDEFPSRLNLPQQGSFQLGYYHQTQDRYTKKEEKENV